MPGVRDVARQREDARARSSSRRRASRTPRPQLEDARRRRDRLDVVHRGRRGIQPGDGGERRLRPRLAALALERLEERRLLAADVRARAAVDDDGDAARRSRLAHRLERVAEDLELVLVLAADVDEHVLRLDRVRRDQAALEEPERDAQHDLAVLERAGLGLVRVDDEVVRLRELVRLGDERPLAARREACAAAAAQPRGLELGDDVVRRHRARLARAPGSRPPVSYSAMSVIAPPSVPAKTTSAMLRHSRSSSTIPGTSSG